MKNLLISHMDSLNFSSENLESLFKSKDTYMIETIKGVGVFQPKRWIEVFGKPLTRNIVEAKILHTHSGLTLAIKRYASSPHKQTLEFAGLEGYTDISELLRTLLKESWKNIQGEFITRIDIAIDFRGQIPLKVIKALLKAKRIPFQWMNTIYFKSKKEKKSNPKINILLYPKHKKVDLDYEVERLELSFRGGYFGKIQVKNIDEACEKMQKTIKRLAGLDIRIQAL